MTIPAELAAQGVLSVVDVDSTGNDELFLDGVSLTGPGADNPQDFPAGDVLAFDQSPDGLCIVFVFDPETSSSEQLWLMDADGANKKRLNPGVVAYEAVFSDDGTEIFFTVRNVNGDRTWSMNKDGSEPAAFATFPGYDFFDVRVQPLPPAGDQKQMRRGRHSKTEKVRGPGSSGLSSEPGRGQLTEHTLNIAIWDEDTGLHRLLPGFPTDNYSAVWSPDGSKIAFIAAQDGNETVIGVVNENGSGMNLLTDGPSDTSPAWLGNDTILYESGDDGNREIYSIGIDGSGETNLTNNPADDTNPVGPLGTALALKAALFLPGRQQTVPQVLFLSDRTGNDDIFVMNTDGTGQTNITNSPTDEKQPKYQISPPPPDPPSIAEGGVVMSNLLPTVNEVSPRSIISVFGANFSTGTTLFPTLDDNGDLDRILAGTCLEMNGERLPIFAVTPGQINAQASDVGALGPASFTVITDCQTPNALRSETARAVSSGVEMATVEEATPVFFIFDPVADDGNIAARYNATESQAPVPVAPTSAFPNDSFGPSRPAEPGDIVLLYGTGWGETDPPYAAGELAAVAAEVLAEANVMVSFGGVVMDPADVLYVGVTPGSAGLYQLALRIPAGAQPGDNEVVLTVYGKSTPVGPIIPVVTP